MLVQFSVENFLSFDEEQIFSMIATNDDQHPNHVVPSIARKGDSVLRSAAIYGANAAGKSNLVQALGFARNFILEGSRSRAGIPSRPFKLSDSGNLKPSKFEFVFQTSGIEYNYGFRINSTRVLEEWLYATPKSKEVKYFDRTTSDEGQTEVDFGAFLYDGDPDKRQFLKFIERSMKPTQLFLSKAVENEAPKLQSPFDWFANVLLVLAAESRPSTLEAVTYSNQQLMNFLSSMLKASGTGIERIETHGIDFDLQDNFRSTSESTSKEIRDQVAGLPEDGIVEVRASNGEMLYLTKGQESQPLRLILNMQHRAKDGRTISFGMDEESEGTQRLLNLAPALFLLKNDPERVLVIDELDRRLHTHLSRFFLQTALECDEVHNQSQIIFTTHDTNLLDLDLLRRDEIWFVEKDEAGASHIYSLAEFKVRPDLRVGKGYLSGRFGAIPFIGSVDGLLCADDLTEETRKASPDLPVEAAV